MTLKSTLLASIVAVALVTLLFGASISYWHALSKVEAEMQAAIAVGSRIAANAVDDAEESADPSRRLHLLIADFNGDRHLRAFWQDTSGRVIAASHPSTSARAVPDWFHEIFRQPEQMIAVDLPTAFDGLGSFHLQTDSRNEVAEVWDDIWNTLKILGVLCMLVLGCVYWLLNRALQPLSALAGALNAIHKSSDAPRIPETGPSEFVEVYSGFNAMAERLQQTEAKNRRLTEQLAAVQEEERADLARDLHDEIGPFLFSVDVDATSIAHCLDNGKEAEIPARVKTIRESVWHMQRHVRELLGRLRSDGFVDIGLVDAIDNLIDFWKTRYPAVSIELSAPSHPLGKELEQTVFRIIQESLSNAMRHGRPAKVEIEIDHSVEGILVEVRDDGLGMNSEGGAGGSGFGIPGMRERIDALSGEFEVGPRTSSSGVIVRAWLPASGAAAADRTSQQQQNTKRIAADAQA
ncbi:MAG: HAMP domain-containing protein [Alphaproteobacteria bacterium]|nr:HAMP domain-containing protein [Alphaproteobacteria bacterium]